MSLVYSLCWLCPCSVFREQQKKRKPLAQPERDAKIGEFSHTHIHSRNPDLWLKKGSVFVGVFDSDDKMPTNQYLLFSSSD